MKLQRTLNASLALVIIAASGMAAAAPEKTKRNKDILKGPSVTSTTHSPRTNDSMESMDSEKRMQDRATRQNKRPVGINEYLMILRQQRGQQAANKLGLSEDQQSQIKAIIKEHHQAMRDFQEKHQDKIMTMKEKIKTARENQDKKQSKGKNINTADEKPQGNQRADQAREKIRSFLESAPANKVAFSKIKEVLTPEQQEMVKAKVLEMRSKRAENNQRPGQARRNKTQGDRSARVRPNSSDIKRKDVDSENAKRKGKRRPSQEDD